MHPWTHMHTNTLTHTCTQYACAHPCMHTHICTHTHMHTHAYAHTHARTHARTHAHTHTHTPGLPLLLEHWSWSWEGSNVTLLENVGTWHQTQRQETVDQNHNQLIWWPLIWWLIHNHCPVVTHTQTIHTALLIMHSIQKLACQPCTQGCMATKPCNFVHPYGVLMDAISML